MWRGIAAAALGGHVGDISHAVESHVRGQGGFGIVEDYTGHGIGSAMHQPPNVPNVGRPGKGVRSSRGWRSPSSRWWWRASPGPHVDDDDWTVRTDDGSLAAHFEHTFTLTPPGRLGADRPRRRRGPAGRARRPLRRPELRCPVAGWSCSRSPLLGPAVVGARRGRSWAPGATGRSVPDPERRAQRRRRGPRAPRRRCPTDRAARAGAAQQRRPVRRRAGRPARRRAVRLRRRRAAGPPGRPRRRRPRAFRASPGGLADA